MGPGVRGCLSLRRAGVAWLVRMQPGHDRDPPIGHERVTAWNAGFSRHPRPEAAEQHDVLPPHSGNGRERRMQPAERPAGPHRAWGGSARAANPVRHTIPLVSGTCVSGSARAARTDVEERTGPQVKIVPCAALWRSACRLKPAFL